MAFTPQQEQEILRRLRNLPPQERQKHSQNTKTAFAAVGIFLGHSAAEYVLKTHGWPAVEKKLIEIFRKV
nr:hypothetical protein [uncultured Flavobacterium sp.]